ncbi:hypothetical protein AVEN_176003-1 [Araneus ventricosus]|uniref:Uncharacterized protein n=1 Tax=Araneus ventricosus TaxID=182803 RepID=A0A4Y2EKH6_ARAVE|nr:hypothetical protein AVEN_176003-1 [Araneus ventricosus]
MEENEEIEDEEEENVILMEESEDDDFEREAAEIREVTYIDQSMLISSTNIYILIDNFVGAKMKTHYSYVCRNLGVDGGELDVTGLKSANLAKSKFILVLND